MPLHEKKVVAVLPAYNAEKTLRAVRPSGLEPELVYCEDEGRHIVERIRALGIPHEEIAILCRTNARLADFEEALHSAEIPYQGSSLLERNGEYVPAYLMYAQMLVRESRGEEARAILTTGIAAATRKGDAHARSELEALLTEIGSVL